VPEGGQRWTTHDTVKTDHAVRVMQLSERVYECTVVPTFAIGQRALLVLSGEGNVLWDCIPLLDEPLISFIRSQGGLKAIAFSHPHYYSNVRDWAETFGCPIYIHQSDQQWIMDPGAHIRLWAGDEHPLWDGMRLINIGGHFTGSSLLHAANLSKEGTVFCGDTLILSPSKQHLAVMYSYPNRIPLPLSEVERIRKRFETIPFDTLYSFLTYQNLTEHAQDILRQSFARYVKT
jgi:glyoxylase-like metal-dependent hydrolase (beta-lactamase superfamily II)